MNKLIFLIGYMGSGKSTVGKVLAKKLGIPFIDTDKYIEEKMGTTISQLITQTGEEEFRKIENETLKVITQTFKTGVVACGGGMPCFFDNVELMKKNGLTLYLKMSSEKLFSRLKDNRAQRPLIAALSEDELKNFIKKSLEKREAYYLQAHYSIKAFDRDIDALIAFLREKEPLYLNTFN